MYCTVAERIYNRGYRFQDFGMKFTNTDKTFSYENLFASKSETGPMWLTEALSMKQGQ